MNVHEASLAREHARDADVGDDRADLLHRREGAAVIAQGDLDAEHFGNGEEFGLDGIRDRRDGVGVIARPHPARGAFLLEATHLGEEVLDRAGHAVRARDAEEGRHAGLDELGEDELGAAALPATFTAAARDVDVLVDETRGHDGAAGVDRLEAGDGKALKALLHGDDPAACDEDVATAELFGGEDFGVLDEDGTGHSFSPLVLPAAESERDGAARAMRQFYLPDACRKPRARTPENPQGFTLTRRCASNEETERDTGRRPP